MFEEFASKVWWILKVLPGVGLAPFFSALRPGHADGISTSMPWPSLVIWQKAEELHGGREKLTQKLDELFTVPSNFKTGSYKDAMGLNSSRKTACADRS